MPTCECGKDVKQLFDNDLRAVNDGTGHCLNCVMKKNFEYMGTFKSAGKRIVISNE